MLNLLFVLAGIYKSISIFIDGSFFVPYLFFICTILKKRTARCTACLYGMLSRIIVLSCGSKCTSFPKASAKVELFSELTNVLEDFFNKKREKINYAVFTCAIFKTFNQKSKIPNFSPSFHFKEAEKTITADFKRKAEVCITIARLKYAIFDKKENKQPFFFIFQ